MGGTRPVNRLNLRASLSVTFSSSYRCNWVLAALLLGVPIYACSLSTEHRSCRAKRIWMRGGGGRDEQTTRLTNVCGIPTIPQECPGDAGKAATRSTVYSLEGMKTRVKGKETPLNPTVDIIQGHLTIFRFSVTGWWLTGLAVGV